VAGPKNDIPADVLLGEPDPLLLQRFLALLQPGDALLYCFIFISKLFFKGF